MQQAVVVSISDPQVEHSAAFEVGEHRPHRRSGFAVLAEGRTGFVANLFKSSVVLVMEEEVLGSVVGDVDVIPAVAVEIARGHAHSAAHKGGNARLLRYIGKSPVAIVAIELVGFAFV